MKTIDYFQAIQKRNGSADIDCQAVIDEENENLTEQSHKKDCDINEIVDRYEKTGYIDPFIDKSGGVYGDFTQYRDYQENLNTVVRAQEAFALLPAEVRKKFENNPVKLMQFMADDKNYDEAVQLNLLDPQKVQVRKTSKEASPPRQKEKSKEATPPSKKTEPSED